MNVKYLIPFIILLSNLYAQTYKEDVLTESANGYSPAIMECIEYDFHEVREIVEKNFNSYDHYAKRAGIQALHYFHSDSTLAFAIRYYNQIKDSLGIPINTHAIFNENAIYMIQVMVELGDYSYIDAGIDIINSKLLGPEDYLDFLEAVSKLNRYREYVKTKLLDISQNCSDEHYRSAAVYHYNTIFPEDAVNRLKYILNNDPSIENRIQSLVDLRKFKRVEVIDYLVENIPTQSNSEVRNMLFINALYAAEPKHLYLLEQYANQEADSSVKKIMIWYTQHFTPCEPDISISVRSLLDSLISYNHQLSNYGWIVNDSVRTESLTRIKTIISLIDSGNPEPAAQKIKEYKLWLKDMYSLKFLTSGAYSYLYHYANYIEEKGNKNSLPEIEY